MTDASRGTDGAPHGASGPRALTGVLAALPGELGTLRTGADREREVAGLRILETDHGEGTGRILACVTGVGKVAAASAAAALVAEGVERLLIVGTCGGLRRSESVGDLVHAGLAIQWDLAVREGREATPDSVLAAAWNSVAPGAVGAFLTADRPAIRAVERLRRARAMRRFSGGTVVADMETAAIAAVAARCRIPWAALRVVSDRAPRWSDLVRPAARRAGSFVEGYRLHAPRPADTVGELLMRLSAIPPTPE